MVKKKNIKITISILLVFCFALKTSNALNKNNGESKTVGEVHNGSLINGYKIPYKGRNYKYFSLFSYYILNRAYTNNRLNEIVEESYKKCQTQIPSVKFMYMECSRKEGGKMWPHRTHQNGMSIDFMVPLTKRNKQKTFYDHSGIFHYALSFDQNGKLNLNKKVSINFEAVAKHILILDSTARKHGMKIKKVILKINLKDELFNTKSGHILKQSGIYFAKYLPKTINNLHDDHYHVDFDFL